MSTLFRSGCHHARQSFKSSSGKSTISLTTHAECGVYIPMLTFLAFAELNMGLDRGNGRLMLRIRKGLLARTECERPEHYPAG